MKAVLISVRPKWCKKIAAGEKTVEVRKTVPKLEAPFKVYIYCTKGAPYLNWRNGICYLEPKDILGGHGPGTYRRLSGKVIGEFICNGCECFTTDYRQNEEQTKRISLQSCVDMVSLMEYEAKSHCLYGWHISDLRIYDNPKLLSDFRRSCVNDLYCESCAMHRNYTGDCGNAALKIIRPPQSWCYVEVEEDG